MTLEAAFDVARTFPAAERQKVINMIIMIDGQVKPRESEKPFRRKLGTLKDKMPYVAPDFDSCFDDDPTAFGLEEFM